MTGLLIKIKHSFPLLWNVVEFVNGSIMRIRYPKLHKIASKIILSSRHLNFEWSPVTYADIQNLSHFLTSIPNNRLQHFNPHKFDIDTLKSMLSNHLFIMMKVTDGNSIIGYHFLRCFFIGKAFHGLIVDDNYGGKGIGTKMWSIATNICNEAGIRMFATISENNQPSLNSCRKGCNATIVKQLSDSYLLIACHPHSDITK